MAKTRQEVNPKSADRLKQIYQEYDITQSSLSEKTGISQNTLSRIANGKTALSYRVACDIADAIPGVNPYWLMGVKKYPSREKEMLAKVDCRFKNAKIRHNFMQYLFDVNGYKLHYLSKDKEIPGVVLEENFYGAIENDLVTSCITMDEFRQLLTGIEDYASYLVKKTIETGMRRVANPFSIPENIEEE